MLELRQLRYFQAVAEELHFGHAAQRLNIVQPALSMQIKSLEEDLGTPLFVRDHHKVQLTAPGKLFYSEVTDILSRLQSAVIAVDRASRGEIGQLRIGASAGAATGDLMPEIIKAFRRASPGVHVSLTEIHPAGQAHALIDGEVDLAFGPPEAFRKLENSVTGLYLTHYAMKLACSADHPLAKKKRIHFDALRNETFVGLTSEEDRLGMQITRYALPYIPKHTMQVRSPVGLFSIVEANLAVSVVSSVMELRAPKNVVFLDLEGIDYRMDLYLYSRIDNSDVIIQNFFETTKAYIKAHPDR